MENLTEKQRSMVVNNLFVNQLMVNKLEIMTRKVIGY